MGKTGSILRQIVIYIGAAVIAVNIPILIMGNGTYVGLIAWIVITAIPVYFEVRYQKNKKAK